MFDLANVSIVTKNKRKYTLYCIYTENKDQNKKINHVLLRFWFPPPLLSKNNKKVIVQNIHNKMNL